MNKQKTIWKVINFNLEGIGQIQQINRKLGKHLDWVESIHVSIIPTSKVKDEIMEVGELSLVFNNQKDHAVHITSSYFPGSPSETFAPLSLEQELKLKTITGYYRDYGTLKNEFDEFINHEVKILLECTIKQES